MKAHDFEVHKMENLEWSWRCTRCGWHLRTFSAPRPGATEAPWIRTEASWSQDGTAWGVPPPKGCQR